MNEEVNKADWLPVSVTYFKPSGKYYSGVDVLLPNDCGFYERRKFLDEYLNETLQNSSFTFVSLDSGVLGFPYMKLPNTKN